MSIVKRSNQEIKRYLGCIFGAVIYAVGLNCLVGPLNLFMGGMLGYAQIVNTLLDALTPASLNLTGMIYLVINIPLMLLSYRIMSRNFFLKTIVVIATETVALSVVPIPAAPILDDPLTMALIGGLISGVGAGFIYRFGGSSGGMDIIGFYLTMKNPNRSIGRIATTLAAGVFIYCFFVYAVDIVIYSLIYTLTCNFVLDKVFLQNIKVGVVIMTRKPDLWVTINEQLHRGATFWHGYGSYSGEPVYVIFTTLSKYERALLSRLLKEQDPDSFMVSWDDVSVRGRFENHLFS